MTQQAPWNSLPCAPRESVMVERSGSGDARPLQGSAEVSVGAVMRVCRKGKREVKSGSLWPLPRRAIATAAESGGAVSDLVRGRRIDVAFHAPRRRDVADHHRDDEEREDDEPDPAG